MQIKIAPSVLACQMLSIGEEIRRAEAAGSDLLHCDVMDGIYVPNISFGFDVIRAIRGITRLPLDVHMMTQRPELYIDTLAAAGADIVTVHHDCAGGHPEEVLAAIRRGGMKCSLAISPKIPPEAVFPYLSQLDMVLVMSVEPGFGGQKFHPEAVEKIRVLRQKAESLGLSLPIEVDGGINEQTAPLVREAGANVLVVGTASFRAPDMAAAVRRIRGESV